MRRKVIKQGNNTLTITLPRKWTDKHAVKPGDEIHLSDKGSKLEISTESFHQIRKIKLDISGLKGNVLKYVLSSLHKKGYDEIELIFDDPCVISSIQKMVNEVFLGFGVIDQSEKRAVLRNLSETIDSEMDNTYRRAFLVTLAMADSLVDRLKKKEIDDLEDVLSFEKTNNQFSEFCERILNKKGYKDDNLRCFIYTVIWNLEKICDIYKEICLDISKDKNYLEKRLIDILEEANKFFRSFYDLIFDFDVKKVNMMYSRSRKLLDKIDSLRLKKDSDYKVLFKIREIVTRTEDFTVSIISLNI